jgi:hypothetical protein
VAQIIYTDEIEEGAIHTADMASWIYNGLDCCVTFEILDAIKPQLDNTTSATYRQSLAKQGPVLDMKMRGLLVDESTRKAKIALFEAQLRQLEHQLNRICREVWGFEINPRSPAQVKQLLYGTLQLPVIRKRDAHGNMSPSTGRDALERLRYNFFAEPICNHLIKIREVGKALGFLRTGIDSDGRMRCTFNIAGTNTGRLSSSMSDYGTGTNLQNVDRNLRECFIADPGMIYVNIDLEQADSRNVGAICWNLFLGSHGPEYAGAYLDACESGDLHTTVCRMAWSELSWPEDRAGWRAVADEVAYRAMSYRDLAKRLGHGCLTEDHEVLTPSGWVSIADKPQLLMAWNPETELMQWESPSHWEDKKWDGDMYEITGYNTSMVATADHRMPVFNRQNKFCELPAELLCKVPEFNLKQTGVFVGGNSPVTAEQARLVAAAQADAHIYPNGSVRWGFSKVRKKERLVQLLGGRKYSVTEYGERVETYYHLAAGEVDFPAVKQAGPWMLNWSKEALAAWVDELKHWDGTQQKTFTWIYGKDREHMQWMQLLCILSGQGASYRHNAGHDCASVGLNKRRNRRIGSLKVRRKETTGVQVYCPTVPSSGFLVRRNGNIMFSLNTNYYGQPHTMAKHTKVDKAQVEVFQQNYFAAFPCIQEWHRSVIYQLKEFGYLTTLLGRRRFFFGRHNEDSTVREAIAYGPQGSTAEEIDEGYLRVWRKFPQVQLLVQVHDSILMQIPQSEVNTLVPEILETMKVEIELEGGRKFHVPLEAKVGWNWGDVQYKNKKPAGNHFGLATWKGKEERDPPIRSFIKRRHSLWNK